MSKVKSYLQLTRAHTAPLETIPAILGAVLATGGVFNLSVALWGIYGVLYHLAGYGQNSLEDWVNGYDYNDPNKQHHPLNTGDIKSRKASQFIYTLLIITAVYAFYLSYPNPEALSILVLGVIFGIIYNTMGKETIYKFLYISIAHTTVFVVPYLALGGDYSSLEFIIASLFVFLWIVFQISVSGEIKDITQDEENFLREIGTKTDNDTVLFNTFSKKYAVIIKLLTIMLGLVLAYKLESSIFVYIIIILISFILLHQVINMLKSGSHNRKQRLKNMSVIEMLTAFIFVFAFTQLIGIIGTTLIIVASTLWVLLTNRVLWGTFIAPRT